MTSVVPQPWLYQFSFSGFAISMKMTLIRYMTMVIMKPLYQYNSVDGELLNELISIYELGSETT
jgi:hypothetical protein